MVLSRRPGLAPPHEQRGIRRSEPDRLGQVGDCRLVVPLGGMGSTPAEVSVGQVGVEGDRPGVVGQGGLLVVVGMQRRTPTMIQPRHP